LTKPQIRKGYRKQRVKRPVEKDLIKGYDSNWEYVLHSGLLQDWNFHTERLSMLYTTPTTLTLFGRWKERKILLEAKGRFWDSAEYSKYVWISQALPDDYELVFLFSDPNAPMPQANLRKDGTKRTHGEWAALKALGGTAK
jgi:hypothetical protein